MKILEPKKMMIIFLCLMINYSYSLDESYPNSRRNKKAHSNSNNKDHLRWDADDYDFENLEKMIVQMKIEQDIMEKNFNLYSNKIKVLKVRKSNHNFLAFGFKLMKDNFERAKRIQRDLSAYIKNVNIQLLNGKHEDKIGFLDYKRNLKERKKKGVDLINKLMRQFLFTKQTKKTIKNIEKIFQSIPYTLPERTPLAHILRNKDFQNHGLSGLLKKNLDNAGSYLKEIKKKTDLISFIPQKIKSFKWKKKKFRVESENSQFSRMRIQSSFRLDEIVNNLFRDEAQGEDVIRAAIMSFLSSVPPHFCWVHDHKLGLPDVVCPVNMKRIGSICYEDCDDGQSQVGGLCFSKCPDSFMDCQMFCSKSNCENVEDFVLKNYKTNHLILNPGCSKGYKKKGNLCYPVCEEIGMYTCSDRTCAMEKKFCKTSIPKLESGVLQAFVEFLGHIYTIKSGKKFGWSNPDGLEKAQEIMEMKYFGNMNEINKLLEKRFTLFSHQKLNLASNFYEKVERIGSSFFKTKDNKPLALIFDRKDMKRLINNYIDLGVNKFFNVKASNSYKAQDWKVCKMSSFSKNECIQNLNNFLINNFPYYFYDLIGYIAKPICAFNLNYSDF